MITGYYNELMFYFVSDKPDDIGKVLFAQFNNIDNPQRFPSNIKKRMSLDKIKNLCNEHMSILCDKRKEEAGKIKYERMRKDL